VDFVKQNIGLLLVSLILGAAGAWLISRWGFRLGLIDIPNNRSSHDRPTPKGGGIGIVAAFASVSILCDMGVFFWLPALILAMISLVGDKRHLSPTSRIFAQFGAAFFFLFGNWWKSPLLTSLSVTVLPNSIALFFAFIVAAVFLVGTANFYNFMDGINGIAALTGMVAFGLLSAYAIKNGMNHKWSALCMTLGISCLGFLPFNCPRAKVFMGDVGSILLGFVFASVVLMLADSLRSFLLLSCFLFPFYADELVTMVERIKDRERLTEPHRRHLYQILANEGGIAHWKVSVVYGVVQLFTRLLFWKISIKGMVWLITALMCCTVLIIVANNLIRTHVSFNRLPCERRD